MDQTLASGKGWSNSRSKPTDSFVGFNFGESGFDPSLDIDGNHKTNVQEVKSVTDFLRKNPDASAQITGNASSPTMTIDNNTLASRRAATAEAKIESAGINPGRVNSGGNFNPDPNNPTSPQNQNATITLNFKRR